jgi:hypothetical protein
VNATPAGTARTRLTPRLRGPSRVSAADGLAAGRRRSRLVPLPARLAACLDAALARVSRVRASEELVREQRRGARRRSGCCASPRIRARYTNLLLMIRVTCEMAAAVLVTVVCVRSFHVTWQAALVAIGAMVLVSYVAVGVSPRTIGRQHPMNVATAASVVLLPLNRILGPIPRLLILVGNALTPGKWFPRGPVRLRGGAACRLVDLAEQRRGVDRGGRAPDDPLGLRAR